MYKRIFFCLVLIPASMSLFAQENNEGQLSGNFQMDAQYYREDTLIGAVVVPEQIAVNSYTNFRYTKGRFGTGVRFEAYMPPINGYKDQYKGIGIPYKYASYDAGLLQITVGNFYEQYGSGLTLRSYEEKNLGYDNAFEGVRVRSSPYKGVYLKGLVGRQRNFWNYSGLVRGVDAEVNINRLCDSLNNSKAQLSFGGSFVSKYQADMDNTYKYPENVAAGAGRINFSYSRFMLTAEYAYKANDPSTVNHKIYKPGEALMISATYSQKGLGVFVSAKRIDNMSFHSDRTATESELNINYVPDITKNHTYSLAAMYPYATQLNGEMGIQSEVLYTIKKGSKIGGKYGTNITVNYSAVTNIHKEAPSDTSLIDVDGTLGYRSEFFWTGPDLLFSDFNICISRKFTKDFKASFTYLYQSYNQDEIHGANSKQTHGMIYSGIYIADMTYKLNSKTAVRLELEELTTKNDYGDWCMAIVELSIPHFFFTVMDQYNYCNPDPDMRVHYYCAAVGFSKGAHRIELGYGKKRAGQLCVGGICRAVPASNGLTLSIVSSF
ncbi:MAG: hypothetical protein KJ607_13295 [Bacteroidetes bacterium]|nr:hypothetical protein [Bacteroidota bacterium]